MSWQARSPRRIYVWPDGGWIDAREFEDALDGWRDDDKVALVVDEALTDREVDEATLLAALGGLGPNVPRGTQEAES